MIETIEHNGHHYPKFQAEGNAAQWIHPFAKHYCKGIGYDVGCMNLEWALDGSIPIDISFKEDNYQANCLPANKVDYIFSSHCLEHVANWVDTLDYWLTKVKSGGIIFLYLPHRAQTYWQPQNNRKHIHSFDQEMICSYLEDRGLFYICSSGWDLNHSFSVVVEVLY